MGLASELGYELPEAGTLQRGLQAVVASRPGAWVAARVLPTLDAWLDARTGRTMPEVLAALPIVALTTLGRRTGTPRRTHLVAIPHGDDLAVIGTNFGQASTPGWVFNLEADPTGTVSFGDRSVEGRPPRDRRGTRPDLRAGGTGLPRLCPVPDARPRPPNTRLRARARRLRPDRGARADVHPASGTTRR